MSRVASALVVALALVVVAEAAADRAWSPGGAVTALDVSQSEVAAGLAWTPRACEGVALWEPLSFAQYVFRLPRPCPQTSTGRGVAAVAAVPHRVVFLTYVGGNTRDWRLWTATPTARAPRLIGSTSAGADDASPIVLGNGGGGGIPYAIGRRVVVLAGNGSRAATWLAPTRVVALAQGSTGYTAAALSDGTVVELDRGRVLHRYDAGWPVTAVRPILGGVVVQTKQGIFLDKGPTVRRLDVPAGARLVGYVDGRLMYALRNDLRLYVSQSGSDVLVRRVPKLVFADFDAWGLAWTGSSATLCWSAPVFVSGSHPVSARCQS